MYFTKTDTQATMSYDSHSNLSFDVQTHSRELHPQFQLPRHQKVTASGEVPQ